jgi:hypothetical protein
MKRLPFALLFATILVAAALAEQELPQDEEEYWTVGIAGFVGEHLSRDNLYLTRSFPLVLRERLEAIPSHFFSEKERGAYREAIIHREQRRLAQQIAELRRERDELFFSSESSESKIASLDATIQDSLERLAWLREIEPERIEFPASKLLRFKSGREGGLLFDQTLFSPLELARQEEVDLLIWGRFEEVQDYLYVEVRALDAVLAAEVYSFSDAGTPEELYEVLDALASELAAVLWGRDWSSLTVDSMPAGGYVWIDGSFQGRTPIELPYLVPGRKEVRVEAPGYQGLVRTLELAPYEQGYEQFVLLPASVDTFLLTSDPEGAEVYEGSRWLGATPLEVQKPDELNRLLLRRQGYLEYPLYEGPEVPGEVSVSLTPDSFDPLENQSSKKEQFYTSFGIFALSVPLPLFFWGYTQDCRVGFEEASNAGNTSEANRLFESGKRYYYAYVGTLVLSASLFVNMVVNLIRYVAAADRKA